MNVPVDQATHEGLVRRSAPQPGESGDAGGLALHRQGDSAVEGRGTAYTGDSSLERSNEHRRREDFGAG